MFDLPDNCIVVSNVEFAALASLNTYEQKGPGCLTKLVGDDLHIVLSQAEYNHMQKLYIEVDLECSQIDEVSGQIEIPEIDIVPAAPKDDGIPAIDKAVWKKMGMDKDPVPHGEDPRPRGGGTTLGSSGLDGIGGMGGLGGMGGRIDIGKLFDR
jgi:hypothetical protein